MQFQVEVSLNAAQPLLDAINNLTAALTSGVKAGEAIETAKTRAKKTPTPEALAAPAPEAQSGPVAPAATPAPEAPAGDIKIETIRAAFAELAKTAPGKEKARKILAEHGAASVSLLKPTEFAQVLAEVTAQ